MGKLIYSAITSLDGYVADEHGGFDWAEPDEEAQLRQRARAAGHAGLVGELQLLVVPLVVGGGRDPFPTLSA